MSPLAWLRLAVGGNGRLRLPDAARAQGVPLDPPVSEAAVLARAHAVRRCAFCPEFERCDALLAAGALRELRAICPNSGYLASQRRN